MLQDSTILHFMQDAETTVSLDFTYCVSAHIGAEKGTFVFVNHDKFVFDGHILTLAKQCWENAKKTELSARPISPRHEDVLPRLESWSHGDAVIREFRKSEMTKELYELQKKANRSPRKCPKCGCQCFDPFSGKILIHDVETCGGIVSIRHNNANAGEFGDAPQFQHCPSGQVQS